MRVFLAVVVLAGCGAPAEINTCVPQCNGTRARECGNDGCGGSCGSCGAGSVCGADFKCFAKDPSACAPDCLSPVVCGAADGCGGSCGAGSGCLHVGCREPSCSCASVACEPGDSRQTCEARFPSQCSPWCVNSTSICCFYYMEKHPADSCKT